MAVARRNPIPEPAVRTPVTLATACAALAVSALLLSAEPVRAKAANNPTIQAAKWAAQPSAPVGATPADLSAPLNPHSNRLTATAAVPLLAAPPVKTIRLTTRTRSGGRYGP